MKTLEQKAKAYDEVIRKAAALYKASEPMSGCNVIIETLFPELKESEDEKIRKWIIDDIRYNIDNEPLNNSEYKKQGERAIDWLEKQGEERKITHEEICRSYGIPDIGEFSDGYHTFNGLYKQRMILFAVLVKTYKDRAWKSWKHEDGLDCFGGGWFIVGIDTPAGTYTYHYEAKDWDRFDCQILEKAKHWDGHDEFDVERLFSLVSNANKDGVIRQQKDFVPQEDTPRYSIGDVLCDKSCTTFNKESQPNYEILDIRDGMYICDKGSFPISHQDEYELVAKRIEQKPTDKVEPKFHEGEWITNGDYTWKIVEVKPLDYILQSQDGNVVDDTISHVDEQFHSFTIKDAKDGDVLYINNTLSESIMIYKSFNNGVINKYASYNKFGFEGENYLTLNDGYIVPATKEQRTELFLKMHEAGYEWDAENKQLNKTYIVHDTYCQDNCKGFQETGKCFTDGDCKAKREAEQKLVESEDEKIRKGLIGILSKYKYYYSKEIAWLKKQGKPSDEEMKTLLHTEYEKGRADAIAEMQKGWSEEDSYYRNCIIQIIEEINNAPLKRGEDWEAYINWLKSLRPQNTWKPSDEQIEILDMVLTNESMDDNIARILRELREQLKKLK